MVATKSKLKTKPARKQSHAAVDRWAAKQSAAIKAETAAEKAFPVVTVEQYKLADVHFAKALAEHGQFEDQMAGAKTRALNCGIHLSKAQEAVPHGLWLDYLEGKHFAARTASRYITFAAKIISLARLENPQATEKDLIRAAHNIALTDARPLVAIANSSASTDTPDRKQLAAPGAGTPGNDDDDAPSPSAKAGKSTRIKRDIDDAHTILDDALETQVTKDCTILAEITQSRITISLDALAALIETLTYTAEKLSNISSELRSASRA